MLLIAAPPPASAQTIYDWKDSAPDGLWTASSGARWSPGDLTNSPPFGVLRFNNNTFPTTTNNVPGTYAMHGIILGSSATDAHNLTGNTMRLYDNGGTDPYIQNESATTHTLSLNLEGDGNAEDPLRININSTGGLTFGGTINNQGSAIIVGGSTSSAVDVTFNGIISGGGFTNNNANVTSVFAAANTQSGDLTVSAGTVKLNSGGAFGSSGQAIRIASGATLNLNGVNATVGSVAEVGTDNGGIISLGAGTLTLAGDAGGRYQNSISGNGGLVKNGTGTLNLYGTQSNFTGTTIVGGGTLLVTTNTESYGSTSFFINSGGTFQTTRTNQIADASSFTMNGGTLIVAQNDTIGSNGVTLVTSTTSYLTAANGTTTIRGKLTGAGNLVKDGNGTVLFRSTANDFTGTIVMQAGFLQVTNNSFNTGVLQLGNGTNSTTFQVRNEVTSAGEISITNGSTRSAIDVFSASTLTHNGNLTQIGGTDNSTKLGKAGAGTLVLNGSASTYGGQIQIGEGTVIVAQNNALSTNTTTSARGIDLGLNVGDTNQANNVAVLGRNGVTISNSIYVAANTNDATRTIGLDGTGTTTFNNEIYLDGTLTTAAASGGNVIISGNVRTNDAGAGGGLTKTGAGTVTLSGNNTYSGTTTISEGTLRAAANNALGGTGGSTTVSSGAALEFSNNITTAEALSLAGTGIFSGGALRNISGNNTNSGAITLSGGTTRIQSDSGMLTLSGGINGAGQALRIDGAGHTTIAATGINTGSSGTLEKYGTSGILTVNAAGDYTGGTTIFQGTLRVGLDNALGTGTLSINGGTFASDSATARVLTNNIAGNFDMTFGEATIGTGDLTLSGTVGLGVTNRRVNISNNLTVLSGNISGDDGVGIAKRGAGTLVLSGTNSYNGATAVDQGTLVVNGSTASSAVTVSNAAILRGTGTVGSTTLLAGSTIAPGNSPGALDINGSLTLTNGASYDWEIFNLAGPAGTGWDVINVTTALDLSGLTGAPDFNINIFSLSGTNTAGALSGFTNTTNYAWKIVDAGSLSGTFSASDFAINTGGFTTYNPIGSGIFALELRDGNDLYLTYNGGAPIPEPGTWAAAVLLACTAGMVGWRRRRARSGQQAA